MTRRRGVLEAGAVLALVLAGIGRFFRLGNQGLWVDEAYTALVARLPLRGLIDQLLNDDAPPLFYLLEKATVGIFGDSPAAVRLFPAAAGVGALLAAWWTVRMFAPRARIMTTAVFGFSSLAIFYAQQARSYSFLHLLAVLLLHAALRLRERPSPGSAIGFWLAATALLFTHNLGVLGVGAGLLVAAPAVVPTRSSDRRIAVGLVAGLLVSGASWLWWLSSQLALHGDWNQWIRTWWESGHPLVFGPIYSWAVFTNGASPALRPPVPIPGFDGTWLWLRWPLWLAAAVGLLLAAKAAWPAGRDGQKKEGTARQMETGLAERAALLFTFVPLLGLTIVSLIITPVFVVGRTDTIALPGFLLAVALGWSRLRPGWLRTPVALLWCGTCLLVLSPVFTGVSPRTKASDSDLADRLSVSVGTGDAIVTGALARPTLEYYARRSGLWDRLAWFGSFPESRDRNPAAWIPVPLDSVVSYQEEAMRLRRHWEEVEIETVWFLAVRDRGPTDPTAHHAGEPWPQRPTPPTTGRTEVTANEISYPDNILLGSLVGLRAVPVAWEYRQDWVGADRLVLRVGRDLWVPEDSIPRIEVRR